MNAVEYNAKIDQEQRTIFEAYRGRLSLEAIVDIQRAFSDSSVFERDFNVVTDLREAYSDFTKEAIQQLAQFLRDEIHRFAESNHVWITKTAVLTAWARYFQIQTNLELKVHLVTSTKEAAPIVNIPREYIDKQLSSFAKADFSIRI